MKYLFLTGGLAAGLLFAQEPSPPSSSRPADNPPAASSEKASPDKSNNATAKFVHKVVRSNDKEIRAAEMASERAESADVRAFAQKLVADHQASNTELKTLAENKGIGLSEGSTHHDKSADKGDKDRDDKKTDKLSSTQGAAFDRAFLEQQTKSHEKNVVEFQKAAASHPDTDVRAFADKQLPVLREHLEQARSLQKDVGSRKVRS